MSVPRQRPLRRLRAADAAKLHGMLGLGLALCTVGSVIEWNRALSGHTFAWVYAFEWPLFAVVGTWIWWRLLHADDASEGAPEQTPRAAQAAPVEPPEQADPELAAWQDYLARLHAADPPGGPAAR